MPNGNHLWLIVYKHFSLCRLSFFRFCVGDKFFLKNNMILCQTDYEEGLMKEGYAPQVRWPQHDTFVCGEGAERGPKMGHAVRHQQHYHPLQPLSLIMYIRNAHYGALLYRIAIETSCEWEWGFCRSPWAKWPWSWILLWLFWNNPSSTVPLRPTA